MLRNVLQTRIYAWFDSLFFASFEGSSVNVQHMFVLAFLCICKEIHLIVGLMSVITDMAKCRFSIYHITSIMWISFSLFLGHSYTVHTFKSSFFFNHLGYGGFPGPRLRSRQEKRWKSFFKWISRVLETDRQRQREDRFAEMSRREKKIWKQFKTVPFKLQHFVTQRECTSRYIQDIFWINLWNAVWKHCGDRVFVLFFFFWVACWGILFPFYPISFPEFYCETFKERRPSEPQASGSKSIPGDIP